MKTIDIISIKDPKSPVTEVFRTLRANIKFISLHNNIKTLLITSSIQGEGKTTITVNLGVTMAQAGNKVLIIDCDLRNPSVHKKYMLSNGMGLTNILMGCRPYDKYLYEVGIQGLYIMPSGPEPPNPSELLGLDSMKMLLDEAKENFDYILLDSPPVMVVSDALLLASICDGTILVVASEQSEIETTIKAMDLLNNVGANIIGAINNKIKTGGAGNSYKYYNYEYHEKSNIQKNNLILKKRGTLDV